MRSLPVAPQTEPRLGWKRLANDSRNPEMRRLASEVQRYLVTLEAFAKLCGLDRKNLGRSFEFTANPSRKTVAAIEAGLRALAFERRLADLHALAEHLGKYRVARGTFQAVQDAYRRGSLGAPRDAEQTYERAEVAYRAAKATHRSVVLFEHYKLWESQTISVMISRIDGTRVFGTFNGREYLAADDLVISEKSRIGATLSCRVVAVEHVANGAPHLHLEIV